MLFPTTAFAIFFFLVFHLHWSMAGWPRVRKLFLLAASWFFYGFWDWRFVFLLAASSALNHWAAVAINRTEARGWREKLIITLSVAGNFGVLGFFKYYTFFTVQMAYPLCHYVGWSCPLPLLDIILPVGISFFTFQAMSYVLDVYRREMAPARSLLDFANYLAFFPQLVAGPIVRAKDLLPQMESMPSARVTIDAGRACFLILAGLLKKMVVANSLAGRLADPVFASPDMYSSADLLLGLYAYAVQIYCDFSAYSDIAIGTALLMGFRFPINFNAPYFATSLQDFWRRWHISLSTWLRDYLYIPLGGSRGRPWRTYFNLMVTFLLGGLWHGAGWTFIVWGAIHGGYLALERFLRGRWNPERVTGVAGRVLRGLGRVWTFQIVCLTWIFFRSPDFITAREFLYGLFNRHTGATLWSVSSLVLLGLGFLLQFLDNRRMERAWDAFARMPSWAQGALAAIVLTVILAFGPSGVAPFIYFQF